MACVIIPHPRAQVFDRSAVYDDGVDRLITSCQPKVRPPLSSSGRDLVPYFAPGAEETADSQTLSEMALQHRRKKPPTSKQSQTQEGSNRKPGQVSGNHGQDSKSACHKHQAKPNGNPKNKIQAKSVKLAASKSAPNVAGTASAQTNPVVSDKTVLPVPVNIDNRAGPKTWAGPSFYNSPAPECLPMPAAHLLAV